MEMRIRRGELRRVAIVVAGFAVLLLGVVLIVVPVPGTTVVFIPLGLAILAREFDWARRLLDWWRATARQLWADARRAFGRWSMRRSPVPCS
jgi:uncharacterized protein (TIGR02611 family)